MCTASFVTCVSEPEKHASCVLASLERMGASKREWEAVPVDNRDNRHSAARALNLGLDRARGDLVVFCHQDVVFPEGWLRRLRHCLEAIEGFGVAGPAGRAGDGSYAGRVIDNGRPWHHPPLPRRVETLDELCLVIRRDSGLRFDERFERFHLYGADLCLEARTRGLDCFAVDCLVEHLSGGTKDAHWHAEKEVFIRKWWPRRRVVGRKIHLTSGTIRLHSPAVRLLRRVFEGKGA